MQKFGFHLKKVFKWLAINYAVLVVLLVSLEVLGQIGYKLYTGRFIIDRFTPPQNWIFSPHPYLGVTPIKGSQTSNFHKDITYTIDNTGFRITSYQPDTQVSPQIHIVCLGGSTTFGILANDSDSWPFLLQQKLGPSYKVYNLGVPGYSTLEGIIQLSTVVPELDPDIIVFFQGWNDLHSYHAIPKSPLYEWHAELIQKALFVKPTPITHMKESLFIVRFSYYLHKKLKALLGIQEKASFSPSSHTDTYVDSVYVRNIRTMQILANSLDAKAIFIPQILNKAYFLEHKEQSLGWTPSIKNGAIPSLMDRFNHLMVEAINPDSHTIVMQNGMNPYIWHPHDFVDEGHFSPIGNEKFAQMVFSLLLQNTATLQ